jgi:UDP-N-acetyl-2-amino-2-deoxyglucuronate dehydrogenase
MAKLAFGIIGAGRMGKVHAFNLAHGFLSGVRLAAVADIDPKALSWCAKHARKAHPYSDYKEMLAKERLDGVILVTPHYSHPEIAIYCIEHGVNVLIEKPLSVTEKAGKDVMAVAQANPKVLVGVSFNQRSNRLFRQAKALLKKGRLGTIRGASYVITNWYRSDAYYRQNPWRGSYSKEGGGCLINQCVHQLDLVQWLFGLPSSVYATTKTVDRAISAENDINAILSYPTFDVNFIASSHELKGINRFEINGDKGRLVIYPTKMVAYFHQDEAEVNAQTIKGYGHAHSSRRVYSYGFFRLLRDLTHGQQLRSLAAFRDALRQKGKLLSPIQESLGATSLINAIYLSSWEKKAVSLPLDAEAYAKKLEQKCQEEKA